MIDIKKLHVAVLLGGPSSEREVSLRSGENVAKQLSREKYVVSTIDIVDPKRWQLLTEAGETKILDLDNEHDRLVLKNFDVFFNVLHGAFGEDGQLQAILDELGVPYTGSGVAASSLAMNKVAAMEKVEKVHLDVPKFFTLTKEESGDLEAIDKRITTEILYPAIIKPASCGSTLGLSLVQKKDELVSALEKAFKESEQIIVQRYIFGREFTCGVLGNSHGEYMLQPLPPIEIIIKNKVFDFDDKYFSKETQEICPAHVDDFTTKRIQELAMKAHETLGCEGLSRTDFRMDGIGTLYYLETNTSPGMTETSLCPKEALALGLTISEFLDHIIELALQKKK